MLPALDVFTIAVRVTVDPCAIVDADEYKVVVVAAAEVFTVTLTALEVDALNVLVPLYEAVIEFGPAGREEVV